MGRWRWALFCSMYLVWFCGAVLRSRVGVAEAVAVAVAVAAMVMVTVMVMVMVMVVEKVSVDSGCGQRKARAGAE